MLDSSYLCTYRGGLLPSRTPQLCSDGSRGFVRNPRRPGSKVAPGSIAKRVCPPLHFIPPTSCRRAEPCEKTLLGYEEDSVIRGLGATLLHKLYRFHPHFCSQNGSLFSSWLSALPNAPEPPFGPLHLLIDELQHSVLAYPCKWHGQGAPLGHKLDSAQTVYLPQVCLLIQQTGQGCLQTRRGRIAQAILMAFQSFVQDIHAAGLTHFQWQYDFFLSTFHACFVRLSHPP